MPDDNDDDDDDDDDDNELLCGIAHQQKAFSHISTQESCQWFSQSDSSDTPQAGSKPVQNPSFAECAIVITTSPCNLTEIDETTFANKNLVSSNSG